MAVPAQFKGYTKRGKGVAWAVPLTITSGVITAAGAPRILTSVTDGKPSFPKSASAGKTETFNITLGTGAIVQTDKVTQTVDPSTGNTIASGTSSDGWGLSFNVADTGKTMLGTWVDDIGNTFLVCLPTREAVDPTEEGLYWMIGELTTYTPPEDKAETFGTSSFEFTGGKTYTADTATTTALTALDLASATPDGWTSAKAVNPAVLSSATLTRLLTGKIAIV